MADASTGNEGMKVTMIPVGPLGTNCYLLASKQKNCAVIDPGGQPDKIAKMIEEEGLTPQMILLTHGHYDHIGGVNKLVERYPGLVIRIGQNDLDCLTDGDKNRALNRYDDPSDYYIEGASTVKEGDTLTIDELVIRVLDTPGHTRGGVIYLCGDAMFAGDTLFFGSCGRCDLEGGDYEEMKRSLRKLADLPGDFIVYPGHAQTTSLDYERKNNYYMAEARS